MSNIVFALAGDVRTNSRAVRQLRAFAAHGWTVDVLTCGPPGSGERIHPNLHFHDVPISDGRGPARFWNIHRQFRKNARALPGQIYHASDLFTLPAMAAAARMHDAALAFDSREVYPHISTTVGRPWVRLFWKCIEWWFIRQTSIVLTVNQPIAERLHRLYPIPQPRIIPNIPAESERPGENAYLRTKTGIPSDQTIILHQGHIKKDRGCLRLIRLMHRITGGVLVFLGDGPLRGKAEDYVHAHHLEEKVYFLDPVPPDQLLPVTAGADIGVTLLQDTCLNHHLALPNKLFEYLRAGLPVLASDLPVIRSVVDEFDVGVLVNADDADDITQQLQYMVDHPEARSRWAEHTTNVFTKYQWTTYARELIQAYEEVIGPPAPSNPQP